VLKGTDNIQLDMNSQDGLNIGADDLVGQGSTESRLRVVDALEHLRGDGLLTLLVSPPHTSSSPQQWLQ
jgi:hypothetical protein